MSSDQYPLYSWERISFLFSMVFCLTILLGVIGFLTMKLMDNVGLREIVGTGLILKKEYHPASSSLVPIPSGKTTTMVLVQHGARYEVCVSLIEFGASSCLDVGEEDFSGFEQGEKVPITYTQGNFTHTVSIKSIG